MARVTSVWYRGGYKLRVGFDDDTATDTDLEGRLGQDFEALIDVHLFSQVHVDEGQGTIAWPDGSAIDAEWLKTHGHPAGRRYSFAGIDVVCPHCHHHYFQLKESQLSTPVLKMFDVGTMGKSASVLACTNCSHISWFSGNPDTK